MDDALVVALFGVAAITTVVIVLFNCVCAGDEGKKDASTGREDSLNNNRGRGKGPGEADRSDADAVERISETSIDHNSKRITLPRRELPQIPLEERPASVYETVSELQSANTGRHHSESSLGGPSGTNLDSDDRLSNDRDSDTDNYDEPSIYATPDKATSCRSGAGKYVEPCPPPVPEKRYDPLAAEPGPSTPGPSSIPSNAAASAVAGRFSAGSIPYMTSPVVPGSLELVYDANSASEPEQRPNGYDSITVRVPLAHLVPPADRTAVVTEAVYSSVQDDGDQMYAEIQSAQNSANSSVTYSKIDPPTILEPPAPPTVESLRSVAYSQSHSRNASSSSFTSDTNAEFAHSPASDRSAGTTGGAAALDVSDLYSTVDKSKKTRASVHVMEGPPALDELYAQVHKTHKGHSLSANRHTATAAITGARPKLYNFSAGGGVGRQSPNEQPPSSSKVSVEPARIATSVRVDRVLTPNVLRRNSSTDDPRYEKISEDRRLAARPDSSTRTDDSVVMRRSTLDDDDDVSEVGYETVKIPATLSSGKISGYETIGGDVDNYEEIVEPNYEIVKNPRRRIDDADDDRGDPGYERIVNGATSGSTSFVRGTDPNYESVRYDRKSASTSTQRRTDDTTVEPRYWLIDGGRRPDDDQDPFYERISNRDEDVVDPNYEKVKTVSELSSESSEPGYESVKKKPQATAGAIVLQEEGYAKVQDPVAMSSSDARAMALAKHHGYEKLNKVASLRNTGVVTDGPRAENGSDIRLYADPSSSDSAGAPDRPNSVVANHTPHRFVEQVYSQNKILEDSLQDDVLL